MSTPNYNPGAVLVDGLNITVATGAPATLVQNVSRTVLAIYNKGPDVVTLIIKGTSFDASFDLQVDSLYEPQQMFGNSIVFTTPTAAVTSVTVIEG
jgi:hypothetical protein